MNRCYGGDISEGENRLVLIDNLSWYLFVDKFIKNGLLSHYKILNLII